MASSRGTVARGPARLALLTMLSIVLGACAPAAISAPPASSPAARPSGAVGNPSIAATPTVTAAPISWLPMAAPPLHVVAALALPDRVLAFTGTPDEQGNPAEVWISNDGSTWRRTAQLGSGVAVLAARATSVGLIAVGEQDSGAAAVWTSPDGLTWSRVADQPAFHPDWATELPSGGGAIRLLDIVEVGGTMLAVGDANCSCGDFAETAIFRTSRDGRHWNRVPHQPIFDNAGPRPAVMTPSGTVVVPVDRGYVLETRDGVSWVRVLAADKPTDEPFVYGRAVVAGGRVVIVRTSTHGNAAVWSSADGRSWSETRQVEPIQTTEFSSSLVAVGHTLVLFIDATSADGQASVQLSSDGGASWLSVEPDGVGWRANAVVWRTSVLAFSDGPSAGLGWTGTIH